MGIHPINLTLYACIDRTAMENNQPSIRFNSQSQCNDNDSDSDNHSDKDSLIQKRVKIL